MTSEVQTVFSEALALPPEFREQLATMLWQSLDGDSPAEVEAAWREEIARRLESFRKGETTAIPGRDVIRDIRRDILHDS